MVTLNRRSFLKAGAGVAGAATLAGAAAVAVPTIAEAATHGGDSYGGIKADMIYTPTVAGEEVGFFGEVMTTVGHRVTPGAWSKLQPEADYGGASVKYVENNDEWLGTTQIVGEVYRHGSMEHGFTPAFAAAAAGEITNTMDFGVYGNSISAGYIGDDEKKYQPTPATKLPLPDPETLTQAIKDFAYFMRAQEVTVGETSAHHFYSDSNWVGAEAEYPYAIMVAVDMHSETYWAASGHGSISNAQSQMAYYTSACIATAVAGFVANLGYKARAIHAGGTYIGVMPVLLLSTGYGEQSRTKDAIMHPRLGFRTKVAGVLTDLPLKPDAPIDFGGLDFCRICMKCADNCPSQSITFDKDPMEIEGYLRWNTDSYSCGVFRVSNANGSSCGTCVKVCPWSSKEDSWFHKAGIWVGSQGELASTMLKAIDDIFGYGTEELPEYNWWLEWPERWESNEMH